MLIAVLRTFIFGIGSLLAALVGYLLLLTGAAWLAPRSTPPANSPNRKRFLFMIPAHNEEQLLPQLLESLNRLDYPKDWYRACVVADNCTDATAEVARQAGALVYERQNKELVGKGYALAWLLAQIQEQGLAYDALVIVDADSVVSENFLQVMNSRLVRGERVIQAHYAVRDAAGSQSASLRAVALAAYHYLRPLGRSLLGGSTGLKGNGMVFVAEVARRFPWPASLTEDIEYHMALILAGERVTFAADATVWAEMPTTLAAAQSQQDRWERGRMEMVRRYVPQLLHQAWQQRSFVLFDAAVEQLIPPLSLVTAASFIYLLVAATMRRPLALMLALWSVGGQVVYIGSGIALARLPRSIWRALLFAPVFIVWKVWLYVSVLVGRSQQRWTRTTRNYTHTTVDQPVHRPQQIAEKTNHQGR